VTTLGLLHVIEVRDAAPAALADGARLRALGDRIVASLGLTVVGSPQWHAFPAREGALGGHTGLWLLAESHLALHSFPERGALTLDLHSCRRIEGIPWRELLAEFLAPCAVHVRVVDRDEGP